MAENGSSESSNTGWKWYHWLLAIAGAIVVILFVGRIARSTAPTNNEAQVTRVVDVTRVIETNNEEMAAIATELASSQNQTGRLINQQATQIAAQGTQIAQLAWTPTPTRTPRATATPRATNTPTPTNTPNPTEQAMLAQPTLSSLTGNEPLRLFAHDADAPEPPASSFGFGAEPNGFVVVVGVDIDDPESGWEIPGSGCEQLLVLPGVYVRNGRINDGSFWSYVVSQAAIAENDDAVIEYAVLNSRERAFEQADQEECEDVVDPDAPLAHIWVVWENADEGWLEFHPYDEWRRSSGENDTMRFFRGDEVFGYHIGYGDSQDSLCDGGNCWLPIAAEDGWCGACVVSPWEGEVPTDASPIED